MKLSSKFSHGLIYEHSLSYAEQLNFYGDERISVYEILLSFFVFMLSLSVNEFLRVHHGDRIATNNRDNFSVTLLDHHDAK